MINGVITGVTAGAEGLIGEEELSPIPPPLEAAGLRFAAFLFAGFFFAAFLAGFFFFAAFLDAFFLDAFFADFFFDAFFFDAFFFATRFLEDFFFAVFLVAFFFAAFFFAAMVKLLSMLDRLNCVLAFRFALPSVRITHRTRLVIGFYSQRCEIRSCQG